ncbi:MAG: hypothetical protein V3V09_07075, partial [Arenicellales bacterium]
MNKQQVSEMGGLMNQNTIKKNVIKIINKFAIFQGKPKKQTNKKTVSRYLVSGFVGLLASQAVQADITGTVHREYDYDAVQSAFEPGIEGIEVQAYDIAGVLQATAFTDVNGNYALTLDPDGADAVDGDGLVAGAKYRVQFTSIPAYLAPTPHAPGVTNTATQFASEPKVIGLGLGGLEQFCPPNPRIATPLAQPGDLDANSSALLSFLYTDTGTLPTATGVRTGSEANYDQIGTIFGSANLGNYETTPADTTQGAILVSAYVKRHAELGPGDGAWGSVSPADATGSIYLVADAADGAETADTTEVFEFLNLNDFNDENGVAIDTGTRAALTTVDASTFAKPGKTGIGGMSLSLATGDQVLHVVNLNDRNIYSIPMGDDLTQPTPPANGTNLDTINLTSAASYEAGAAPSCGTGTLANDLRPFAMSNHDGR